MKKNLSPVLLARLELGSGEALGARRPNYRAISLCPFLPCVQIPFGFFFSTTGRLRGGNSCGDFFVSFVIFCSNSSSVCFARPRGGFEAGSSRGDFFVSFVTFCSNSSWVCSARRRGGFEAGVAVAISLCPLLPSVQILLGFVQ